MRALEISELSPQELGDNTLVLVYTDTAGAGRASLEAVKAYFGILLENVEELVDENGRKTTLVTLKSGSKTWPLSVSDGIGIKPEEARTTTSDDSGGMNSVEIPTTGGGTITLSARNGLDAAFDEPDADAEKLAPHSEPTATVEASGPDTHKKFSFHFGIPESLGIKSHEYTPPGSDGIAVLKLEWDDGGEDKISIRNLSNDELELIKSNAQRIETLEGGEDTEGSVKNSVAAALASIIADAPDSLDTLKEISEWIAGHEDSAAEMNSSIRRNASDIAELRDAQQESDGRISGSMLTKVVVDELPPVGDAVENVLYWVPSRHDQDVYMQYSMVELADGTRAYRQLGTTQARLRAGTGIGIAQDPETGEMVIGTAVMQADTFAEAAETGVYEIPEAADDQPPHATPVAHMCRTVNCGNGIVYQTAYPATDDEGHMVYMRRCTVDGGVLGGTWKIVMVG